jgi:hypothetical protein
MILNVTNCVAGDYYRHYFIYIRVHMCVYTHTHTHTHTHVYTYTRMCAICMYNCEGHELGGRRRSACGWCKTMRARVTTQQAVQLKPLSTVLHLLQAPEARQSTPTRRPCFKSSVRSRQQYKKHWKNKKKRRSPTSCASTSNAQWVAINSVLVYSVSSSWSRWWGVL